jgi:hypothetical protein
MKTKRIRDLKISLGTILKSLGAKGGVVEIAEEKGYLLLPLDDELVDSLLERSPN